MKRLFFLTVVLLTGAACAVAADGARKRICFDDNWRFMLADSASMALPDYNDGHWRQLSVPHDWAIEGDFYVGNKAGASGGALPGGVGWYRKWFQLPANNGSGAKVFLAFDGVYMNSTVYVNGQKVGNRPYGYSSFEYDITPYVRGGNNVVAVRVDNNDQPNSRWYSGCGIYRHVWLTTTNAIHIKHWGVYIDNGRVSVDYDNPTKEKVRIKNTWYDADGKVVSTSAELAPKSARNKWSPEHPYVYTVRTQLLVKGKVVDEVQTTTGFRDFHFDAKTGLWLNGKNIKINGVCQHHDMGCLGAALSEDALHRQLSKLKRMGCNAIRCSHNPPAPELLNMCDTMGLIVMDESFDMWRRRKSQNDYARFFDQWAERDLTDLVLRDRNHPSVLMWSIGNEVLEQWSSADADTLTLEQANLILNAGHDASALAGSSKMSTGAMLTQWLAGIVRRYDQSRPVTAGCNEPSPNNHLFKSGALDIIGFNYHHQWVKDVPQ
ncbi:MAG: beta galactosidase jelly roll domain-containing protein, partial [Prevotella sp.]|nr:beta galactosidase jelly roll domain-containing protein [Prevotella sp.]